MPDFEALSDKKAELIRKPLAGGLWRAPITADPITELTGPDSLLLEMVQGYEDVGMLTNDGQQWAREVTTSDVQSWGENEPTRQDVTADSTSLTVAMQETKLATIGLGTGADLSAVVPAANGEVSFAKPARPKTRPYRLLGLMVDDADEG